MHELSYYTVMAEYNQWMNERLYALCATLPDTLRKADRGAFFGSIHKTLNHLVYGDRVWLGRFTGKPFSAPEMGCHLFDEFAHLRQAREVIDRDLIAWTKTLSVTWLQQPFSYHSNVDGKTRILPTWLLVVHLFNHQTHHRGQLSTLLGQLGYDPGITDLPWLPTLVAEIP